MAQKREDVSHNSKMEFTSLQDVLYSFNNSINEEQAWAVCYQCAQYLEQNPSQDCFRDLYYYGISAIRLSKEGDVKIEMNFSQGTGKGPPSPKKRSSFSLSREFKTVINQTDVIQALGTAIYKALDFGLSESEEPHLSSELEALIESLTDHPNDDDEGIDIERDSDQDIDDSQGKERSVFQDIIDSCKRRLSKQQNAQVHYTAVCRALATEATELATFLDNIAKGQEKLASTSKDDQPSVDDLERADWARLWVQIMRDLRHGVRLKKVEQVHLPPMEYELTPFEILLEDIRLGRYKLNSIMVNGDIPRQVKDDAHAVILDFIRSRPPLKPVNRRMLKERPKPVMDPRELLMMDICKPHKLKPVRHGKRVVRKPTLDCDTNYSSDEDGSPKPVRKVIKPVSAFQVSTDDSDSSPADYEEDYSNHINGSETSSLNHTYLHGDSANWKRAVTRDLAQQPSSKSCSVSRRHTISACDMKSGKKVSLPSQHATLHEDDEDVSEHNGHFSRDSMARKATKIVSYRTKHSDNTHVNRVCSRSVSTHRVVTNQSNSQFKHLAHCTFSKSHGNLVDGVISVQDNMHEMSSGEMSRLSRSASVASISDPQRCRSPSSHIGQSHSSKQHAGRSESPVRHLTRSETFTCSVSRTSRVCTRNETHIAARCDSPQTRAMKQRYSVPSPRSKSEAEVHRPESPRRHSIQMAHSFNDNACDNENSNDHVKRHSVQHAHGLVSHKSHSNHKSQHIHNSSSCSVQRHASFSGACVSKLKNNSFENSKQKHACTEGDQLHNGHGHRSRSKSPVRGISKNNSIDNKSESLSKSSSKSIKFELPKDEHSNSQDDNGNQEDVSDMKSDNLNQQRTRATLVRARSRPEIRSKIKDEEEKHFQFIEKAGLKSSTTLKSTDLVNGENERVRSASEIDFSRPSSSQIIRARSGVLRPVVSRSISSRIPVKTESQDDAIDAASKDEVSKVVSDNNEVSQPRRGVKLSRQPAVKNEGSDIRARIIRKVSSGDSLNDTKSSETAESKEQTVDEESKTRESRTRRVGVITKTVDTKAVGAKSVPQSEEESASIVKPEVSPSQDNEAMPRRHLFRQVRPILRSRSEARPEMKPVKGSHNLPVDFEHNNLDHSTDKHLIIPPPEFRDPVDLSVNETDSVAKENTGELTDDIPDVIKTSRAQFKLVDLLHVSWNSECARSDSTNQPPLCSDFRLLPSHKWQNPIECLSLTLEEVTHIRCVLTKAELESLITQPELHSQVSKGKVCFTCKKTKFSLFGQWGTKCKFCQRTVCNYCLRKMSVPTEHFEKVPVYTLSPVPLSPEVLEALKIYESTGSVPHSPVTNRKTSELGTKDTVLSSSIELSTSIDKSLEEPASVGTEESKAASRRKSLQRSHTIGVGVGSRPPPNKALLRGPQMSICCECKSMIMEIIRASRSSVSLITGRPEPQIEDKPSSSPTPQRQMSTRSAVVTHPRLLDTEERPRPRSMLENFKSFNFSKQSSSDA